MKRALAAIAALALVSAGWIALAAEGQPDRPRSLSTTLTQHPAVPAVMRLEINGRLLSDLRTSDLRDTGPLPYEGGSDDLAITVSWVEHISRNGWQVQAVVPVADLSTFSDGNVADLRIQLGAGADVAISTRTQAYWRLIEAQDPVTDADRLPVFFVPLCATPLDPDSPLMRDLMGGFEDWAVAGMEARRDTYFTLDGGTEPVSHCAGRAE